MSCVAFFGYLLLQPMPLDQQNAEGFHYLVRWRRHDVIPMTSYDDRTVDASSNSLIIDNVPVYKPFEIYVLAINEVGEAVSPPVMSIRYSAEDGQSQSISQYVFSNTSSVANGEAGLLRFDEADASGVVFYSASHNF